MLVKTNKINSLDVVDEIFLENPILYKKLKELDKKKQEIKLLRNENGPLNEPIIITISGTPRSGKTTCIDNLFEFLKKANIKTSSIAEPAGLIYSTLSSAEEKKELLKDRVTFVDKQYEIGLDHIEKAVLNNEIIVCDRGIIDTFIWYHMYYMLGMVSDKRYDKHLKKLSELKNHCNYFYALMSESFESLKRDYLSSLSIEPRTTMNEQNIINYNNALLEILPFITQNVDHTRLIDTTSLERMDASVIVANEVLDNVKKLILRRK